MGGDERRTRALEIAVSILGSLAKDKIDEANKNGDNIIRHYLWLVKAIDDFIATRENYNELLEKEGLL